MNVCGFFTNRFKRNESCLKKYDYLIVGSGLFGSVFARQATDCGKSCLVIEKREHLGATFTGGNINGINVHVYGAHIFHTNNRRVWNMSTGLWSLTGIPTRPSPTTRGRFTTFRSI